MRCFSVKNRDRGPDETQGKKIIEQGESKGRNNEQNDSRSEQRARHAYGRLLFNAFQV